MNVLVACEESQRVCKAFRDLGHNAFSCDLVDCSGGFPQWHIKDDCLKYIDGECTFVTCDGCEHIVLERWDLIIAHPPCTYLTSAAERFYNFSIYGDLAIWRNKERRKAAEFFMKLYNAKCSKVCIENPFGYISRYFRPPNQVIQPFEYGHKDTKPTCLWLRGLELLKPTCIVKPEFVYVNGKKYSHLQADTFHLEKSERSRLRSQTYEGIACAMALQWGGDIH